MIVVHPKDPSTKFLHLIYEDIGGVLFFDSISQREQILEAIRNASKDEYILLLGHGSPHGLLGGFIRDDDAELLRDRPNLVGIWCYASSYAFKHGLKGFFSGMFISEWYEAEANEVSASLNEINEMCWTFAGMFGDLLRAGYPLEAIAADLKKGSNINSELTKYNFTRLTFRKTGMEDLPVSEDYWEYEDASIEDSEIVSKGVDTEKRDINAHLWQRLEVNMDLITKKVMKNCLKQLLNKYCDIDEALHKPSPKELAEYSIQKGIACDRKKSKIFSPAYYVIHLYGFDFTLSKSRGDDATCIEIGEVPPIYTMGNLYVYLSPPLFYTMMGHLINRIVPLISPAIEEYIWEVKKKVLVSEIRKAARRGRK